MNVSIDRNSNFNEPDTKINSLNLSAEHEIWKLNLSYQKNNFSQRDQETKSAIKCSCPGM